MVDLPMPRVLGYCDDWSKAAGDTIRFRIASLTGARAYRAQLVRVISPDTGPDGPGLKTEDVAAPLNGAHEAAQRPIPCGSFVLVDRPDAVGGLTSFTVQALVQPMLRERPQQAIVSTLVEGSRKPGFALLQDERGALAIHFADGTRISTGEPMQLGRWHHVAASIDAARGEVFLRQTPLPARGFDRPAAIEAAGGASPGRLAPGAVRIGAVGREGPAPGRFASWLFNGKIEAPSLADRALTPDEIRACAAAGTTMPPAGSVRAAWDFTQDISTTRIIDLGPRKLHGVTVNAPKRAATGARWDGTEHDWRRAPAHYGAIHFHEDDLYDACWPDTLSWTIPAEQRSAIYALRLDTEGAPPFWITFFVRPPRGKANARAAFLASTATYSVYANYRARMMPSTVDLAFGALQQIDPTDMLTVVHPELGASTYDKHPDGSGVCHVSTLRPLVNVRPTGRLWNLQLDFCLIDWLEDQGFAYDVITDDDLHREGLSLLENYQVVMSGCHPEYWSPPMWDGLEAWLNRGGRFMYLGGNGFYWKVTYVESHPGLIELRRAEGGTRAWAEIPGEYLHASTGELGGLWRRNGRFPQRTGRRGLHRPGLRLRLLVRAHARERGSARRLDVRGRHRGATRRLWLRAWRRRRHGDRQRQHRARHARACAGGRILGRAFEGDEPRGRGDQFRLQRRLWRDMAGGARGHHLFRDAGRRGDVVHRIDQLCRQPGPQPLRERDLAPDGECPQPIPGFQAFRPPAALRRGF
jgi:N,N-dimethylformamidase